MINWFLNGTKWILFYLLLVSFVSIITLVTKLLDLEFLYKEVYITLFAFITIVNFLPTAIYSIAGILKLKTHENHIHPQMKIEFLVIIPAYNEKEVILNSVDSLLAQKHGKSYEAKIVVAFNGIDETGDIARSRGAEVINTPTPKCGKAKAIQYALTQIGRKENRYVIIIDADNVVREGFLQNVSYACSKGQVAYQCNHQPLLSNKNWVSLGLQAAYAASSRLFNSGRSRLLNSALLCGTGMVIREDVMRDLWPKVKTQTEDIELNGLLSLHLNEGVEWIQTAVFYDEKPDQIDIAIRQRVRWMVGHTRCFYFYFVPLLKDFLLNKNFRSLEILLYYMTPFSILLSTVWFLLLIPTYFVGHVYDINLFQNYTLFFTSVFLVYIFLLPALGFYLQNNNIDARLRLWQSLVYAIYSIMFASLTWPIAIIIAFMSLSKKGWIFHTPHKAKVELVTNES